MVIQITDATLDKVLKTDKPVVIDFWAEWCGLYKYQPQLHRDGIR